VGQLTTEERNTVTEILADIKKKEKEEMEKTKKGNAAPPAPSKYSSVKSRVPNIPKM